MGSFIDWCEEWDATIGVPGLELYSTHCQVWAVLNDLISEEQGRSNLKKTFGVKGIPQCSVSMSFYLLQAFKKAGMLIIVSMMNAFNVILVKNYYQNSIPAALREAARIDGCSEFGIFWKIVMPLSIPINATIGVIGLLPVLIVYPFLQKYFVKGITVGAVKE